MEERQKGIKTYRQIDKRKERLKDRKTERQKDRKTERQNDRMTRGIENCLVIKYFYQISGIDVENSSPRNSSGRRRTQI